MTEFDEPTRRARYRDKVAGLRGEVVRLLAEIGRRDVIRRGSEYPADEDPAGPPAGVEVAGVSVEGLGVLAFSRRRPALTASSVDADAVRASTSHPDAAAVLAENGARGLGGVAIAALAHAGIGVYAVGGQAPLLLGCAAWTGPPGTDFHAAGELILDAECNLYLCKKSGTPGTWKLLG